jgi:hypothetical protein
MKRKFDFTGTDQRSKVHGIKILDNMKKSYLNILNSQVFPFEFTQEKVFEAFPSDASQNMDIICYYLSQIVFCKYFEKDIQDPKK